MWLPGAVKMDTGKGRPYRLSTAQAKPKWVIHTMECPPDLDPTGFARTFAYPPHFWVSMPRRLIIQTVDTSLAAQALAHEGGMPETNHAQARQVEIAGRASEVASYPKEWWEWLGKALIQPVAKADGIKLVAPYPFISYPLSYGYNARQRIKTQQEWYGCNSVVGHQHVIGNDHGDPGNIPIDLVLGGAPPVVVPPPVHVIDTALLIAADII